MKMVPKLTLKDARIIMAGGLPIFIDDQIVGGVGCSSGHADQDEMVAQAGVDALFENLKQ